VRILITGNMGYVGPVLARNLRTAFPGAIIEGFDCGYFGHCLAGAERLPEARLDAQHFGDVRDFPRHLLDGVDAVIELAAISNDPMGRRFSAVTDAINHRAAVSIARMAAEHDVKHLVFASSCSIYGQAEGTARREDAAVEPLTVYAKSKAAAERDLAQLADSGMTITALRFATACGMSDRLRLDLVLNEFVAAAVADREISILSDGTPWRPLIDVKDMARAIEWAIGRDRAEGGAFLVVNVGSRESNFQVRDLAEAVARAIPGTRVNVNKNAPPDKRSYRVDFSLYERLAPRHQPQTDLDRSIGELRAGLERMNFKDSEFRSSQLIRLRVLEAFIAAGRLTDDLRWV
jgi:nucleoside-diphosphate-sugar epimerase